MTYNCWINSSHSDGLPLRLKVRSKSRERVLLIACLLRDVSDAILTGMMPALISRQTRLSWVLS